MLYQMSTVSRPVAGVNADCQPRTDGDWIERDFGLTYSCGGALGV